MQQLIKRYCWVALLVAGAQASWGFALSGPLANHAGLPGTYGDRWQTPVIGYGLGGDLETPKNIAEEYRRNTPVMVYAFNQNFSSYFGSNGEAAVVSAFTIMNQLTNVDNYSDALTEYSIDSQHQDTTALALGLTDLKSETLNLLAEQMGLSQPERFTWTLHDRYLPAGGKCPINELYLVVQRNFDPMTSLNQQVQYSPYVNDTLYTYEILEACTGANPLAQTFPISVDPLANTYTAVAGLGVGLGSIPFDTNTLTAGSIEVGGFYTDLTRDDVAGLRYMYRTNNVNWESPAFGASWFSITTNNATQQLFPNYTGTNVFVTGTNSYVGTNAFTSTNGFNYFYYYDGTYGYGNYSALVTLAKTTSPAVLQALYPGLVISSSSNYYVLGSNAVYSAYFTNYVGSPVGSPPVFVVVTNYIPALIEMFTTTFANVFTNRIWSTNSYAYMLTSTVGVPKGYPVGSPVVTNVTSQLVTYTNVPSGDFFVLPQFYTNVCPLSFLYPSGNLTNVLAVTNVITSLTSTITSGTNGTGSSNLVYSSTLSLVTYFTNYTWIVNPVNCTQATNATTWYQGIGRIQFVRIPDSIFADPLTETFSTPYTNNYTMVAYNPTNNAYETRYFQRILLSPDILFSAEDLASPLSGEIGAAFDLRNLNFNVANILPNLAGPGTIETPTEISFDKVGNVYGNGDLAINNLSTNEFLSEFTQIGLLGWGSYDGSTNDPVVYPSGTSIYNIENQLIISVTPTPAAGLADGYNGVAYGAVQFSATGGVSPYTWAVGAGTSLPAGLSLSAGGVLSGTPANNLAGVYDFTIQLTDAANRVVNFNYSITIH